jgi:hypothetical protein
MRRALIVCCIGLAFAVSPISLDLASDHAISALAAKGGNGGGTGSGGGGGDGSSGGRAGGADHSVAGASGRDSAPGQNKEQGSSAIGKGQAIGLGGSDASSYGKLNGFMHASSTALAHASVKSPLGTIARIYAGQLGSYLAVDQTKATPEEIEAAQEKLESAALTLAGVANKPLSQEVVASVNSRLGDLAKQNSLPGQDPAVSAALSGLATDDPSQKARNDTLAATIAQMAANAPSLSN